MRFRQIVHTRRAEYLASTRRQEKDWIARQVMTAIRNRGGRFLRKIDITLAESQQLNLPEGAAAWNVVDEDEVLLKVKQAMRDRSLEDEEPRPRRRRRVRSNNVVLDEDLSLEEAKRAARRPRTDQPSSPQNHQSSAAQLAQAGRLLQGRVDQVSSQQQQQPRNQQQADLADFFIQQQQLQGHQQQTMMLAEFQRQQNERQMAQLIEEHRLRNSLGLQGASIHHHHHAGNFGGMPSLRDMPASLGYGGGGGAIGGINSLPDIATLTRLHSSVGQQPGNLAMQQASFGIADSRPNMAMSASPYAGGQRGSRETISAASLGGQTGLAYVMAATAALARRSSAGSSQASTTAGQVAARLPPPAGAGTLLDESSQLTGDTKSIKESSGELAIEQAFDRMNRNPGGGALLHMGQYLKISLIEGCLLSLICSFGIPQCWSVTDDMAGMFIPSPTESHEGKTTSFTWADLSNLLKEKVGKMKSCGGGGDQADEQQSALATAASSNPALTSSAAVLAQSFTKDPKELARMAIMLLEKMRIHSRIEQLQNNEHLSSSNGSGPSSRDLQTSDNQDICATDGDTACDVTSVVGPGSRQMPSSHQEYLLWQHLSAELAKWATLLDVANEGTGRPIAHSLFDVTPKDLAEEEVVTPVAALDMTSSRKILAQAACLSRLGALFQRQPIQEITDALKYTSTKQHMTWVSRPTWWLQHDKESITRDVWLLENLVSHGLASILDVPISSTLFPVGYLRDAGLTKAVIKDRVIQLTVAIHEQVQTRKRVQVEQERASKLSVMMSQPGERSESM